MNTAESTPQNTAPTVARKTPVNIPLIISWSIFAVILVTSGLLFWSNRSLEGQIAQARATGVNYDASIAKLQNKDNVIAAEILAANESSVKQNIKNNEVQRYIGELRKISKTFKIQFSGFSYQNGKITTMATATNDILSASGADAITKISALIGAYRSGSGNIFQLAPVTSISGQEQKRSLPIEFSVVGVSK